MLKEYRVKVNAGEVTTRGSSPRVAVGRALEAQFANSNRFKGADCKLDYQLKVGETLVIKCTRLR